MTHQPRFFWGSWIVTKFVVDTTALVVVQRERPQDDINQYIYYNDFTLNWEGDKYLIVNQQCYNVYH